MEGPPRVFSLNKVTALWPRIWKRMGYRISNGREARPVRRALVNGVTADILLVGGDARVEYAWSTVVDENSGSRAQRWYSTVEVKYSGTRVWW